MSVLENLITTFKRKMAIGVNTSKWKPRQLRGTPAARARDIVGLAVISFAVLSGAFYQYSGVTAKFRKALECLYEDPVEEVERKQMIAIGLPNRTGDKIRQIIEHNSRPDLPDK